MPVSNNSALWILMNLREVKDEQIIPRDVYTQYKEDILKRDGIPCSQELFFKTLHSLFKNIKTSRHMFNKKTSTYLEGLTYTPESICVKTSITAYRYNCPAGFVPLNTSSTDVITITQFSTYVVNGSHVLSKTITFKDNSWSLNVGAQQIDLNKVGVDVSFNWTQEELNCISTLVKCFKFCLGKKLGEKSSYVYEEQMEDQLKHNSETSYRSKYCTRITAINALSNTCERCIRYVVRTSNNKEVLRKKYIDDVGLKKSKALRDTVNKPNSSLKSNTTKIGQHQESTKTISQVSSDSEESFHYPCGICYKDCDLECIECSYCKVWIHFKCAGLTASESFVVNDNEDFKCKNCMSKGKGKHLRKKKRLD